MSYTTKEEFVIGYGFLSASNGGICFFITTGLSEQPKHCKSEREIEMYLIKKSTNFDGRHQMPYGFALLLLDDSYVEYLCFRQSLYWISIYLSIYLSCANSPIYIYIYSPGIVLCTHTIFSHYSSLLIN